MPPVDPVGPYENWMFGPGRYYDLPGLMLDQQPSLSALVEFADPVGASAMAAITSLLTADGITWTPRLPVLYRPGTFHPHFLPVLLTPSGPAPFDPTTIATLLTQLAAGSTTNLIRLNFPVRSETVDTSASTSTAATLDPSVDPLKPLVILAVIDHGIPFAHRALRTATSTRVDYCWSQSAETDGSGAVIIGREFRRDTINALMTTHNGDEDAIYRVSGLLGHPSLPPMPLARLASHGAHILGTAANSLTDPQQYRIIAVDLPATSVWDTSGFGADMVLLAALHYIFDRAEKIAAAYGRPDAALVINLSYGVSGGPHDGTSLLGAAMDEMIAYRRALAPTALMLPSGNMFQDRLHARLDDSHFTTDTSGTTRSAKLTWMAPPADRTSSFIELWYPPGTNPSEIKVNLKPPRGIPDDPSLTIGPGAGRQDMVVGGRIVGQLEIDKHRDLRWRVTIILAPSEAQALPPAPHGPLPAGLWTITLRRPNTAMTGSIDARIQRDTNFSQGNTGARQSCFVDPVYEPMDPSGAPGQLDSADPAVKIRRFGGLNGIADGATGLVVAGYRASTLEAARYSSAGPSPTAGPARAVSLSAMTDRAAFTSGLLSTGTRTGATVAQNGTSVAAPQAARFLAERLYAVPTPGPTADNYLSLFNLPPGSVPIVPTGPGPAAQDRLGAYRLAPPPPWPLP